MDNRDQERQGRHGPQDKSTLRERAAAGNTKAAERLVASDPSLVDQAFTFYQTLADGIPRAAFLNDNPYLISAFVISGKLSRDDVSRYFEGSVDFPDFVSILNATTGSPWNIGAAATAVPKPRTHTGSGLHTGLSQ